MSLAPLRWHRHRCPEALLENGVPASPPMTPHHRNTLLLLRAVDDTQARVAVTAPFFLICYAGLVCGRKSYSSTLFEAKPWSTRQPRSTPRDARGNTNYGFPETPSWTARVLGSANLSIGKSVAHIVRPADHKSPPTKRQRPTMTGYHVQG